MASVKIVVSKADGTSYDVRIGEHIIDQVGSDVAKRFSPERAFLVYDGSVSLEDRNRVKAALRERDISVAACSLANDESSHSLDAASEIWQAMAAAHVTRGDVVVGMGDAQTITTCQLIAHLYMGGIPCVCIPSTLMAACTHCLGGFSAAVCGDGYIGRYVFPQLVCIDVTLFDEMPEGEWEDGFAQIVQTAVLGSDDFYFWLCDSAQDLANRSHDAVVHALAYVISLVADIRATDIDAIMHSSSTPLSTDEAQMHLAFSASDMRSKQILLYGDEIASALVSLKKAESWGRAHAEGMRFSMHLATHLLDTSSDLAASQDDLFTKLGLRPITETVDAGKMMHAIQVGSYKVKGGIQCVLPRDVGQSEVVVVPVPKMRTYIQTWCNMREQTSSAQK